MDFIDGTIFLRLMETLSGKTVKRYHMFPQSITQRCDNVQLALDICSRYLAGSVRCDIMCDLYDMCVYLCYSHVIYVVT